METFQQHLSSGPGLAADLDALFAPPPPGHSGNGVPTFSGDTPMALAGPAVLRAPPPPSAVAAAFAAAQPLPAQPSPPLAGPASQQKEVVEAERRAIAREKNRMAQRRFRWVLPLTPPQSLPSRSPAVRAIPAPGHLAAGRCRAPWKGRGAVRQSSPHSLPAVPVAGLPPPSSQ